MRVVTILVSLVFSWGLFCQVVEGNFGQLNGVQLKLGGYNGKNSYWIDSVVVDDAGNFSIKYTEQDKGMGFLYSPIEQKSFTVVLSGEDVQLIGDNVTNTEDIVVKKGKENKYYLDFAAAHARRQQVVNALYYLNQFYSQDSLFIPHKDAKQAFLDEKNRILKEDVAYEEELPEGSYLRWLLPLKKLMSAVPTVVQFRNDDIPATRDALRAIDYADDRLYKSGLLKDAIESHIWFLENSSGALERVYEEINTSIDIIFEQLVLDEDKFNEVTALLFNVLEKRSLFQSAEYLSLKILNENSCTPPESFAKQLEGYRKMKKGNTAPNIEFGKYTYYPNHLSGTDSLKALDASYYLVIFASSTCGHCVRDIPELSELYEELKDKGVEFILVSLDTDVMDFANFVGSFPFTSTTSLQGWEDKAVKDYYVFGTPTFYVLDKDFTILIRPNSIDHVKSWFNWRVNK